MDNAKKSIFLGRPFHFKRFSIILIPCYLIMCVVNSLTILKYCYSGIQRKKNVKPPTLPSLQVPSANEKDKVMQDFINSHHEITLYKLPEPESHPSPSQTESLVSCIPFKLQTMRFCVLQVVHTMASGKCRCSSWFFGLDLLVCFRFELFRFACDLTVPLLFACS